MDKDTETTLDLGLARALRDMERETEPERDLWPGIERRIAVIPLGQNAWLQRLMISAVAASFIMASASLLLVLGRSAAPNSAGVELQQSVVQMEREFLHLRNPMIKIINESVPDLDEKTLLLVFKNFEIIENARKEIELALLSNPEDLQLLQMLRRLRQQEIDLLDATYAVTERSI